MYGGCFEKLDSRLRGNDVRYELRHQFRETAFPPRRNNVSMRR
jgi:hypothetical protein